MKKLNLLKVSLMIFSAVLIGCGDDGDDSPTPAPGSGGGGGGGSTTANSYSGAASVGDLVTFSINKGALTYDLTNETTNQTESGNFTVKTDSYFEGIYQINVAGSDPFFAVELDDKIVAANFPSGNANNDITVGVSSEIDNTGRTNEITGDYVYVRLGSYLTNKPMEWGVVTLDNSNLYVSYIDDGSGGPETYDIPRPVTSATSDLEGTWVVNNDRLDIAIDGSNYTGYVYAAGTTAAFILDLGPNEGAIYAYKIDDSFDPNNSVGDYKFIDYNVDGDRGAGNFNISSNGNIKYSWTDGTVANTETNVSLTNALEMDDSFTESNIPNVWYAYDINPDGDDLYLVVAGDAIMYYIFDDFGTFQGWGAGAKI